MNWRVPFRIDVQVMRSDETNISKLSVPLDMLVIHNGWSYFLLARKDCGFKPIVEPTVVSVLQPDHVEGLLAGPVNGESQARRCLRPQPKVCRVPVIAAIYENARGFVEDWTPSEENVDTVDCGGALLKWKSLNRIFNLSGKQYSYSIYMFVTSPQ